MCKASDKVLTLGSTKAQKNLWIVPSLLEKMTWFAGFDFVCNNQLWAGYKLDDMLCLKNSVFDNRFGTTIAEHIRELLKENPDVSVLPPLKTNVAFNIDRTANEQTILLEYDGEEDSSHDKPTIDDQADQFLTLKRVRRQ